jgi:hypothetical protein
MTARNNQVRIPSSFTKHPQNVFTEREITDLFPTRTIIDLKDWGCVQEISITTPKENKLRLYIKGKPTIYEIAAGLEPEAFISHASAAWLHGLMDEEPLTIYTTFEQSAKEKKEKKLLQENVDKAFSREQRISGAKYSYQDRTILLLNGMATGSEGIIDSGKKGFPFPITNIERTLIDVTVRPAYSGRAIGILDIYRRALKKDFSAEELLGILDTIPFAYPYHQAIGFYLERAGYRGRFLKKLKKTGMDIRFYLDYGMEEKKFSEEWQIYYPADMDG